ncbi:BadF/BadG/BcrA/BcrD ATPase family protein [uncultured Roseobacter sp.]|uniref:BadF/BadG/BcrA/BcrD ATPase family protein n=1 Tax=uncultured Roseobacter sp. TaxID=114847 RepID=UPI00262BC423|nr:BadF/BadG/BcrA/BcrD ATPase family protein [uncultured Roseobacter sp.]
MSIFSAHFLVGVDGGGTGCRVVIADPGGTRISEAPGGPANFATDPDATLRNILSALQAAGSNAGLADGWQGNCIAHLGLAGVMDASDAASVAAAMSFRKTTVTDDRITSLTGALREDDGILAAIGTGTIVASKSGHAVRYFGGWGHDLADQASGGWLGHNALRRAMLAQDGLTKHSDLTTALLAHFNDAPNEIVQFTKDAAPGDYASFAPLVVEAARQGDPNALTLMQWGAEYLNTCIATVGLKDGDKICLAGGVGPHYEPYVDAGFRKHIHPSAGSALDGALHLAQQHLHSMGEVS